MPISSDQLREIMPALSVEDAGDWAAHLNAAMDRFKIDTPLRQAHFLAQIAHESGQLKILRESFKYSAARLLQVFPKYFNESLAKQYEYKPERIASRVYGGRLGNGPESTGDGFKYKGRGPIQITGKTNYTAVSQDLFGDNRLVDNPDMLMLHDVGALSAAWFWNRRDLNTHADDDNIEAVTKLINGGHHGLDDRKKFYERARIALGV